MYQWKQKQRSNLFNRLKLIYMKSSVIYTLNVWLTAVLLSPVIIMLTEWLGATNIAMGAALLIYGVFMGMLFSVTSAVLFAFSTYVLNSIDLKPWHKNTVLSLIGILSTLLAFLFVTGKSITIDGDYFCIPYASVIVAGIWFYKLEPDEETGTEQEFI